MTNALLTSPPPMTSVPPDNQNQQQDLCGSFYTPIEEAMKQLRLRRHDVGLRRKVKEYLDSHSARVLRKFSAPRAIFFRQIGSPTHELLSFLEAAKSAHLSPLILEYHGDKFVGAHNPYKRGLGKLPVYHHTGKDGIDTMQNYTIVDFPQYDGRMLSDVKTTDGTSLVSFHHIMLKKLTGLDPKKHCVDATDWFKHAGGHPTSYYEQVFALLIRDGILFENYIEDEADFMRNIVRPAYIKTSERFDFNPLIVKFIPREVAARKFWDFYPPRVAELLNTKKPKRGQN